MSTKTSISFLYSFDLGNRHVEVPTLNIPFVTSTAVGDFSVANITTDSIRHKWRSATALVKQEIIIKAEKTSNINCFAILGHNFTDAAYVTVQANVSNNFAAPPVTKVVAWSKDNMLVTTPFGGQYQYYKISILDIANPCGYVEIGRVVGGTLLELINNEDITDAYQIGYKDMSEVMKTSGYFRSSNSNIIQRSLSCNFSKLYTTVGNDTNFNNLRKMFQDVKIVKPFLVILDYTNPYRFNAWMVLTDIPDESYTVNDFVNFPVKFEEVF
jgi:hypothetical protein